MSDELFTYGTFREGSTTLGRVYIPFSHDVWKILDRFEDPIYRRSLIEVYQANGSSMTAHAYILPADQQHLLSSERHGWKDT